MLFGGQQMGVNLAQVLEIGIDQRFVLGRASLLFEGFSGLFVRLFFRRGDGGGGRRGIGLPGG